MGKVVPLHPRAMEIEVANQALRNELDRVRSLLASAERIIDRQAGEIVGLSAELAAHRPRHRRSLAEVTIRVVRGVLERKGL
jgi:hypothetical protein